MADVTKLVTYSMQAKKTTRYLEHAEDFFTKWQMYRTQHCLSEHRTKIVFGVKKQETTD